jgi:four helix bundle protein
VQRHGDVAVRRVQDLIAWQLAEDFKHEVQRHLASSAEASADLRYRGQLLSAASAVPKDVAEGFIRYSPSAFIQFLDYALGSLVEAEQKLKDGIELGYFPEPDCAGAFRLARRCLTAVIRLKQRQQRYLQRRAARSRPASDSW